MTKFIMLQGTSSHVGKSIVTAALCRIFRQNGEKVAPFKAQNMALNSYVTKKGEEMGRAQVVQAEAAGIEPMVEMNPVLLKPTGDSCSQVVLMGKSVGNMTAKEYHQGYSLRAFDVVKQSLNKLSSQFDVVVIEGAGSPAEVNLKANDIVNMRVAKHLNAPVLLIADIDRGGALASVVGTLELLEEDERALVKGIVINKFRGDLTLLKPALDFLERKTGKPVLGVVPYLEQLGIEDEDSVSLEDKKNDADGAEKEIRIAVLRTPKISNFTDFDSLAGETDVSLYYAAQPSAVGDPDLILLPGSKNTTEDLLYLRKIGMEDLLKEKIAQGVPVIGICGGYQMLGHKIFDPHHTESSFDSIAGFGLLPIETTFAAEKLTTQITAHYKSGHFLQTKIDDDAMRGYEIHMGRTDFIGEAIEHPLCVTSRSGKETRAMDGVVDERGLVMGTYLHGLFDNDGFRRSLLNALREKKGLPPIADTFNVDAAKQNSYNRLADTVRDSLDMNLLAAMMEDQ